MRVNYQDFLAKYRASGLSMSAYGAKRGMSYGMVRYYVKRAEQSLASAQFVELEVAQEATSGKYIVIRSASGLVIQIPV